MARANLRGRPVREEMSEERKQEIMSSIPVKVADAGFSEEELQSVERTIRTLGGFETGQPIAIGAEELRGLYERLTGGMNDQKKNEVLGIMKKYWPDFTLG